MPVTHRDIETAAAALSGQVVRTPTIASPRLSELFGMPLFFKLENLQFTGSFKDRGACNKLLQVRAGNLAPNGVVAASAGNHAQGVAYHARRLGIAATIVMPQTTPFSKAERTEALGATVVLHGESLSEAYQRAQELVQERQLLFIHPYDDDAVIAGQGTAAVEMLQDQPELDVLVVPIGGGGLIAGMATWARHVRPRLRILGVQTEFCPSMVAAVRNQPAPSLRTHTLADGIAVKQPGERTRAIIGKLVDDFVLVDETAIEHAVQVLVTQQKTVTEGAGAAAFAAVCANPTRFHGEKVGVVISGGIIFRRMLSTVLLRGLARDGKVARLRIEITDLPGTLSRVTRMIGATGADIIEIEHERLFSPLPPRQAELDVVLETRGKSHVDQILRDLHAAGFPARAF